jgi:acetoin utilization deacetylase AcuC-like enzyme
VYLIFNIFHNNGNTNTYQTLKCKLETPNYLSPSTYNLLPYPPPSIIHSSDNFFILYIHSAADIMSLIYHERYLDHVQSWGHPERPARLKAILAKLETADFEPKIITPEPAKKHELTGVHNEEYVDLIENFGEGYLDPDTFHREETFEIASLAAGGGILAADLAFDENRPTFVIPRPPGHHATACSSGGFCYFNNVAIAAQNLLTRKKSPAKKVAIVDIDVHHGNGTHDIFLERDDVLYISTHQWGIYPGTGPADLTGDEKGEGFTVNIPFYSGAGDSSFELAYQQVIEPVISQYKPSIILISIGTDAHYRDPLANLALSSNGYLTLAKKLIGLSKKVCQSKVSFFLEGGYDVNVLAEIVTGILANFENKESELEYTDKVDTELAGESVINDVLEVQKTHWDL